MSRVISRSLQHAAFRFFPVRAVVALAFLVRGSIQLRAGRLYRGLSDYCWICRVADVVPLARFASHSIFETIAATRRTGRNLLAESYREDPASRACASLYVQAGGRPHDLWRDLIVLKKSTPQEKGVILLKYGRTFEAVVAMFDLPRLMDRYTFVLEPCWAGYCDPSILMMVAPGHPVLVQCFTEQDTRFVQRVGTPLVPIRMGPADWVDADLFAPPAVAEKPYDVVMVANWGAHKRHRRLFEALGKLTGRKVRVLLIGFPWAGRTADDIRREADATLRGDRVQVEIMEKIPAAQVAHFVAQSKVFVFLSVKEGDNKALVEAMFADVPAVVYRETIGGATSRINSATGILASDDELPEKLAYMLDHHTQFRPRAWALEHTGSGISTERLDAALRDIVTASGGHYTEPIVQKTNSPNLAYKETAARMRFHADYEYVLSCRRGATAREAVA